MRLINGDCLQVMDSLISEGVKVDLTVTSPPYDNLRTYNDSLEWGEHIWKPVIEKLYDITADGGVVVWVVGDATIKGSETGTSFKQALYFKDVGFNLHDTMIYEKSGFSNPSNNRCHQVFEYMFIFSKAALKTFNKIMDRKNIYKTGGGASFRKKNGDIVKTGRAKVRAEYGQRYNIWRYSTGGGLMNTDNSKHPAQFPEQLASDHIISWSNEGDIVFDPFMGSGTTGKMAVLNNRDFIGIEKVDKYFEIAKERIKKVSEQMQFKEHTCLNTKNPYKKTERGEIDERD